MDTLTGKFLVTLFRNPDNFYTVARFRLAEDHKKLITVTGCLPEVKKDQLYELSGEYAEHPKYGLQFRISSFKNCLPEDDAGVVAYLTGPRFPGIGRKTAEKLARDLGKEALERIEKDPGCLGSLSYLSPKKRQVLIAGCQASEDHNEQIFRFFGTHQLTMRQIVTLQRVYQSEIIPALTSDPYRIVYEVPGIGFEIADRLGRSLGFELDDPERLAALAVSLLDAAAMQQGDSYLPEDEFRSLLESRLEGLGFDSEAILGSLAQKGRIFQEEGRIYPRSQYLAETLIAGYFQRFPADPLPKIASGELEPLIGSLEERYGISYDATQNEAITEFFRNDDLILTGGPGTGKTTVVKAIMALIRDVYPEASVSLCAPTGRAAKRLKELTGNDAKTIHSLLKFDLETGTFALSRDNPILTDILIVDEFSMVDQWVLSRLLDAGALFRKILIIGDEDQLPSVAPGKVLGDLIESGLFPLIRLGKIFRQKEGSGIITLAHEVAAGEFSEFSGHDVRFIQADAYSVPELVREQYRKALEAGYRPTDVQVLAPMYNGTAGIDALNRTLQKASNPPDPAKRELRWGYRIFRQGDKILQLKNQPDDNVFNGDIGILSDITFARENSDHQDRITVDYDGIRVEFTPDGFDKIAHAFCVSVHKAQGSEYPVVIMPVLREYGIMMQKRLIYTAITRAEKSLVLIGSPEAFRKGIATSDSRIRHTTLKERLLTAQGEEDDDRTDR